MLDFCVQGGWVRFAFDQHRAGENLHTSLFGTLGVDQLP